jgi:multiple sugar transport system ATP-binding protein
VAAPRAVYEAPDNLFVASFLGAPPMNLIELRRDGAAFTAPCFRVAAPSGARLPDRVTLGVRPEHMTIAASGDAGSVRGRGAESPPADGEPPALAPAAPGRVVLRAAVARAEPLGAETYVYLDAAGTALRARAPGFDAPAPGAMVDVAIEVRRLLWVDTATGLRIDVAEGGA